MPTSDSILVGDTGVTTTSLRIERPHAGIVVLTLDRPGALNALDAPLMAALYDAFARLAEDAATRVVVLTGAGRGFCSGQDVKNFRAPVPTVSDGAAVMLEFQRYMAGIVGVVRALPQPVIAAVNGVAVGGGMALACASDIRLAGPAARFAVGGNRLGLSGCEMGLSYQLPRIVGMSAAAEWLLTGRFVEAAEAVATGLVSRLVDPEVLLDEAVALAKAIAANTPFGVRMTKQIMWANVDAATLADAQERENAAQVMGVLTDDAVEYRSAARERRAPTYLNR